MSERDENSVTVTKGFENSALDRRKSFPVKFVNQKDDIPSTNKHFKRSLDYFTFV